MAKQAVYQVRMDEDIKNEVEALYRDMGTSFAEAVRMFAVQSLREGGLPFFKKTGGGKSSHLYRQAPPRPARFKDRPLDIT